MKMALNSDQLMKKFLKLAYPIHPKCTCRIEIRTMEALRSTREKRMRIELKGLPEETKRELIHVLIEKEENMNDATS